MKQPLSLLKPVVAPRPGANRRNAGFTLVQLLICISIVAALAAMSLGTFSRYRERARRAQCDNQLKGIAMALASYRDEVKAYPASLTDLATAGYIKDAKILRCPSDRASTNGYADFYVKRPLRRTEWEKELPVLTCPFHERSGNQAGQVYTDQTVTQFLAKPSVLTSATAATVVHADGRASEAGYAGMELHGGDRIETTSLGKAVITFADNSSASVGANAKIQVMQSFQETSTKPVLYTMLKQTIGTITYTITPGSKFDVATPTATAGAHGTKFTIRVNSDGHGTFKLIEGKVVLSTVTSAVGTLVQLVNGLPLINGILGTTGEIRF